MEIIPVINCADFECVRDRAEKAETFSEWVHLDIADGKFSSNISWNDPQKWNQVGSKLMLEVHLMVMEPRQTAEAWLDVGARRVVLHLETITMGSFARISESARSHAAELMLAVASETPVENLQPYFPLVSKFQVLAVPTGPAGSVMLPGTIEKIKFLRRQMPDATIEVDGGIIPETARIVKDAGANLLAAGSYLFKSENPKAQYEELRAI